MIDHLGLSVSDLGKSRAFYTKALAPLGYSVMMEFPGALGFGAQAPPPGTPMAQGKPDFWLGQGPSSGKVHVAFTSADRKTVDAFHAAALAAGGKDNGKPGLRPQYHPNYYGAFVFDPDGNNIEAVTHQPE
jgi:catechol 2,3-dioxygenase-like lactoylglutathione lyase family enzyme